MSGTPIWRPDISDIFISYSREDQSVARLYAEALEAQGFSVWWDAALRQGEAFDEAIETALRAAKAVVVLWSPRSVASRWVRAEATLADRNKTLAPVIIEPCERPIMFELTQTVDLSHWRGATDDPAWLSLVEEVRRFVGVRDIPQAAVQPAAHPAVDGRPSILVLPLINMSGDPEQEYFSDGVSEDIITDLGRVSALSVVSRTTAFSYKGKTIAPGQLAAGLGVTHILEGSVRKSGARVRITAQLLDAARDTQVWGERFDRTLDDIFAIQDEISQAIVGALKLKLAPAEKEALGQRPTANAEAYEFYLLARQFERTGSERLKPLIVRICQRAVELDPQFGHAWALIAIAEAEAAQRSVEGMSYEHATHAAERAVAVSPNLAEAHASMAEVMMRGPSMDLAAGQPFAETALRLDPDSYDAHLWLGYQAIAQKRWNDAVLHFEAAIALDPVAYRPAGMILQVYRALGDQENLLAAARRCLTRCERLLALEPDHGGALGFLVTALSEIGDVDRAREWSRRAVLFDPDNMRLHYNLACGMAELGDADAACDLLDGIIDKVSASWLRWMDADNSLDLIREHPRFIAVMARGAARFADGAEGARLEDA